MLLAGLRLSEVLSLRLEDFNQKDRELRVRGKGDKDRVLPVCEELMERLLRYLRVERPEASRAHELFVCLKGKRRGESMTRAGLRRLFRYHREVSTVENASPHRFRHTFATDLVRAGLDLPYLMELLGHEHLKTVALYTHLTPRDVRIEFDRAMRQRAARGSPP
jgi:site-specific recombinase XerD